MQRFNKSGERLGATAGGKMHHCNFLSHPPLASADPSMHFERQVERFVKSHRVWSLSLILHLPSMWLCPQVVSSLSLALFLMKSGSATVCTIGTFLPRSTSPTQE